MYHKFIITSNETSHAVVMSDCYDHALPAFQRMIAVARRAFSTVKDEAIKLRTVTQSSTFKDLPFIYFKVPANSRRKGWENLKSWPDMGF